MSWIYIGNMDLLLLFIRAQEHKSDMENVHTRATVKTHSRSRLYQAILCIKTTAWSRSQNMNCLFHPHIKQNGTIVRTEIYTA